MRGHAITSSVERLRPPLDVIETEEAAMRLSLMSVMIVWASTAGAHVGHVADVAGHGHWVGAAAIGLAVLVGLYGKRKDRDQPQAQIPETGTDTGEIDTEEATA